MVSTHVARLMKSSTVLNGQPTTNGFPPFFLGSGFLRWVWRLIQPGPSGPGQTNTVSKNFLFSADDDGSLCANS